MKQINHKKLTSNELVNKILVANLSENDTIYTKLPMFGMTDRRCFDVVLEEFHKKRLTKEECHFVFDEYFHLYDKITSMDEIDVAALVPTGYRRDLITQCDSWIVGIQFEKFDKRQSNSTDPTSMTSYQKAVLFFNSHHGNSIK